MPQIHRKIKLFPEDKKDLERLDFLQGESQSSQIEELEGRATEYLQRSLRLLREGNHQEGVLYAEKGATLKQELRSWRVAFTRQPHRLRNTMSITSI